MNLTASDRSALIRLASTLSPGSVERKTILAGLKVSAAWSPSHAAEWLKKNRYTKATATDAQWTAQFVNDKRANGVLDRFIFPALHGELRRRGLK